MTSALLPASIFALGSGPALASAARTRPGMLAFLDGFVLVTIGGLVMLDVIPHAIAHGDWWAALFMLAGFTLPTLAERLLHFGIRQTHAAVLLLALLGIAVHSALDGSAIAQAESAPSNLLGVGVLLHQLPVSMMVWLVLSDRPRMWTWLVLALMAMATVFGYAAEPTVLALLPEQAAIWFEALVGGSLLHVIAHPANAHDHEHGHEHTHRHAGAHAHSHVHDHAQDHSRARNHVPIHGDADGSHAAKWPSGLGALAGVVVLAVLHWSRGDAAGAIVISSAWATLTALALESAPAVVLALMAAGLAHAFITPASIAWLGKGSRLRQGASGMLLGLPVPICSCGVVPLYQGLVKQGVPATAALAFLVATPELGFDAVLLSLPLLGAKFATIRVIAAIAVALTVALVMGRPGAKQAVHRALPQLAPARVPSAGDRLALAARTGFGETVDHTAPWIVLGLIIAALASPALQQSWLTRLPTGVDVLVFAALGLPLYVCASASTPLVAVLVAAGVSPGAGLALLITGPATNVATLGVLTRMHGRAFAIGFAVTMTVSAVVLGIATNLVLPSLATVSGSVAGLQDAPTVIEQVALAIVCVLFGASVLRRGARGFIGELRFARAS